MFAAKRMRSRFLRFSSFYFFYFALLGAYLPYWPVYLSKQGFALSEVGELMAIALSTKLLAPYLWGWLADRTQKRLQLIQWSNFAALLSFLPAPFVTSYGAIAVILFLYSFFWNASLPQLEVLTLHSLKHKSHRYSLIRIWGSIGFIAASLLSGFLISILEVSIVPWIILLILFCLWLSSYVLSVPQWCPLKQQAPSIIKSLTTAIVALYAVCFLIQFVHGPYYAYFTIFMEQQGYGPNLIAQLWALGVFAEIIIFIYCAALLRRYTVAVLLAVVICTTSLRWLLTGYFAEYIAVMIFAQSLHAITFGVYHAVMIHAISKLLPAGLEGRGQALYASLSFGVGGSLGIYFASQVWETLNATLFLIVSLVTLIALLFLIPLWHLGRKQALRMP